MGKPPKWTEVEDRIMLDHYARLPHWEMANLLPGRSRSGIISHASKLHIVKDIDVANCHNRIGNLAVLLEETPRTYYMVGVIAADGSFNETGGLRISVRNADAEWFKMVFAPFTANFQVYKRERRGKVEADIHVAVNDCAHCSRIKAKFDLGARKTYKPPTNLEFYATLPDDLFLSFLVGFIDGDGCIRHNKAAYGISMSFCGHKSWRPFFEMLRARLGTISGKTLSIIGQSGKDNTIRLNIGHRSIMRLLKATAIKHNLPILRRKWDLIDENRLTMFEVTEETFQKVKTLISSGTSFETACNQYNVSSYLRERFARDLNIHPSA